MNDLLANLLSKSFSNAFKRPVGKSKSASPTTDIDNTTNNNNKCNDSFKFDTREVEGCQENLVVNEHIPTRSQLHQWEQSFDKLLADTEKQLVIRERT
ncbi:unnamed protein product [Trichobilharzia regenti]|nr:unnamed protein product [Trichobilharzia regenti]